MPSDGGKRISPGDLLEVTVSAGVVTEPPVKFDVRVNEQTGIANVQLIGPLRLAGLEVEEAEAEIAAAAVQRSLYRSPFVTVAFKQRRKNQVMVIGAVREPGLKELAPSNSNLLGALVAAGGLTKDAGANVLVRIPAAGGGQTPNALPLADAQGNGADNVRQTGLTAEQQGKTVRINLVAATREGPQRNALPDGSIVMVEKLDPEPVKVLGLVNKPGQYDYPVTEELRILDAIALASGTSNGLADKVLIIRNRADSAEPAVIQVSIRRAKWDGAENIVLAPGDVVTVEQTAETVMLDALKVIRFAVGTSLNTLF